MAEGAAEYRLDIDLSQVDSSPLDRYDDVFDVKNELITVAARWRDVGIALRLKYDTLNSIEIKCNNDPSRCLELMVEELLKRNYNVRKFGEPTWKKLVVAVNSPAGGANAALAKDIAGKHQAGGQLTSPPQVAPPSTLSPQRTAGAISPQLSPSVGGLLSTNHLEGAQAQLQGEIKQFEEKYEDLVDDVLRAFKTGGVPITRVLKCLRQLPVSLKQQCGEFLQSQAARLSRVSNIDELFFILSLYWDFLNPNLLAHLSHRFGDDQIVRSVDEYLGELKEFRMRTKIDHFIDMWTGILSPDTQEIVMELGDNWREQSLEQLEELRIEVSRKRCFEDYVMPLKRIKLSSVDAVFSLPESVDIHNLELESLREFFQENQVLRILLNGVCIFNLQLQKSQKVGYAKVQESSPDQLRYCAKLYYWGERINRGVSFVITKNLEAILTDASKDLLYPNKPAAIAGAEEEFEFDDDKITLKIPIDGVSPLDGWKIIPINSPTIYKSQVDTYEGKHVPSCEISITWMKDEPATTKDKFHYRVDLEGAKGHKFLIIESDPAEAEDVHHRGKRGSRIPALTAYAAAPIERPGSGKPSLVDILAFRGKERKINIPQEIGSKYFLFGILLLEDHSGAKVHAVSQRHGDSLQMINLEILLEWLAGKGKQPVSWQTLTDILRDIGCNALASDIEIVKCT